VNDRPRSSTATILFTGLMGAEALRARLGEEQAGELRRLHDDLLTIRIEANSGQVLKAQGDGLVAAFDSANDGLTSAVQIQQAIASYNQRSSALAELSVRMGMSVGDVSWEDGDGFGTPLVEAARLQSAAEPGQVLCTEWVRMMAGGRGGHEFADLGFFELKGLPEPVAVCALRWAPFPEPVSTPLRLPSEIAATTPGGFVSRADELRQGDRLLSDPARDRVGVLWLLGEPGIGKTRLATEIARRAHAGGAVVLFGRCSEDLSVPFQPFVEALRTFVEEVPTAELAARLGAAPGELVRLVPDLTHRLADLVPPGSTAGDVDEHRIFEAVRSWMAAAGGDRPVVAVFDDVHWAARPTLQMLSHVARSAKPSRALLVCTARNTSPDDNEELAGLLIELEQRDVPSHRLELGGLGPEAVAELVERSVGRRLDDRLRDLASRLHTETAGNPLFVGSLLAAGDQTGELPRTVSETVRRRTGRLPAEVTHVLRIASVVGLDFDLPLVARAAGRDELDVLDGLEAAGRAGLVQESGPDRYRFAHALVRAALRDELSQSRRVRIHLRIGDALEALRADALDDHADALAYHFSEAAPVVGPAKAFRYTVAAAERASRQFAHLDAASRYGRALEMLPALADEPRARRCQLLVAQAEAYERAGEFETGWTAAQEAFTEARDVGAVDELVRAALTAETSRYHSAAPAEQSVAFLKQAEAVLPVADSRRRAVISAALAAAMAYSGRPAAAVERAQAALAMARRIGDASVLAWVLVHTSFLDIPLERAAIMSARAAEVCGLAEQLDDDQLRTWGCALGVWSSLQLGDLASFDEYLAAFSPAAERLHRPIWTYAELLALYIRALIAGDLQLAESLLIQHRERFGRFEEGVEGVMTFFLRREQGRLGAVAPALRLVLEHEQGSNLWRPGLVALYMELGMMAQAREEFERLAADDFVDTTLNAKEIALGFTAEACVAFNDAERAEQLLDRLGRYRGKVLVTYRMACLGPVDRFLAMLSDTVGRPHEADALFDSALELCRRMPSPLWLAHCLHDGARHWAARDPERAEMMRAEAAELCERHHLAGLARKLGARQC
jgi:class 3 adenylate cyclase